MNFDLGKHISLLVPAGSRAYNLHTPESDFDYGGICIPPLRQIRFGIGSNFEQVKLKDNFGSIAHLLPDEAISRRDGIEGTIYDIKKFVSLASQGNPNILEVLFSPEPIFLSSAGRELIDNRFLFLSKRLLHSYSGYAFSQFKRIELHRSYLLNPPKKMPERSDFGLPPKQRLITKDEENAFLWVLAKLLKDKVSTFRLSPAAKEELDSNLDIIGVVQSYLPDETWPVIQQITGATSEFIDAVQAERKYGSALNHWNAYTKWQRERNPKRAALEKAHGYDTKHGLHIARLTLQGKEILRDQNLTVRFTGADREFLMSIRQGALTYDQLGEWFKKENAEIKLLGETTQLPHHVDLARIDNVLIRLQEEAFEEQK